MPITPNLLKVSELAKSNTSNIEKQSESKSKEQSNQNLKEKKDQQDTSKSNSALRTAGKNPNDVNKATLAAAKGKQSNVANIAKSIARTGLTGGLTGAMESMSKSLGNSLSSKLYSTNGINNNFFKGINKAINKSNKAIGIFNDYMCCDYRSLALKYLAGTLGYGRTISSNLDLNFGLAICPTAMKYSPFNILLNMDTAIPSMFSKPKIDWKETVFSMLDTTLSTVSPLLGRLTRAAYQCIFNKALKHAYNDYGYGSIAGRDGLHNASSTNKCLQAFKEAIFPSYSSPNLVSSITSISSTISYRINKRNTIITRSATRTTISTVYNTRNTVVINNVIQEQLSNVSTREDTLHALVRFGGASSHQTYGNPNKPTIRSTKSVQDEITAYNNNIDFSNPQVNQNYYTGGIYTQNGTYIPASVIQYNRFKNNARALKSARRHDCLEHEKIYIHYPSKTIDTIKPDTITLNNGIQIDSDGTAVLPVPIKHTIVEENEYSKDKILKILDTVNQENTNTIYKIPPKELAKKSKKENNEDLSNKEDAIAIALRIHTIRVLIESKQVTAIDIAKMNVTADTLLGNLATVIDFINVDNNIDKIQVYEDTLYILDEIEPDWCKDEIGNYNYSKVVYNEVFYRLALNHFHNIKEKPDLTSSIKQTKLTRDQHILLANAFHLSDNDIPAVIKDLHKCKC